MLTRLVISDVVLIEKLALQLTAGLNVFTGETGAGKSILLDALGLALGGRSDISLIRAGASQASVTAEFDVDENHGVFALAEEHGLNIDLDSVEKSDRKARTDSLPLAGRVRERGVQTSTQCETKRQASPPHPCPLPRGEGKCTLILRRVIGKDGKSRAFINDQPISIGLLKQFGEQLLEIHGQFETHGLLNPVNHRGLLDAFSGLAALKQKTTTAFAAWKDAEDKQSNAAALRDRAQAEEDFLRSAVAELEQLNPEDGEAEKLAERRTSLQHREKITEALQAAEQSLNSDRGAATALAQAGKAVARIADKAAGLQELLATIDRAAHETGEAVRQLEHFLAEIDAEPDALQHIEERLFALRAVARKHNVPTDALVELRRTMAEKLALLTDQGDQLTVLAKAAAEVKHAYKKLADELSAKRSAAAVKLEKAIAKELPPLKLERAQFKIDVSPLPDDQWSAEGMDKVAFLAATNPGTAPGALQKIASGGELARFMLALKVVLAAADPVPVLVFDEVDSGIGGATASAVGERLAELAKHVQILVVTHSPQVAARGDNHLRVLKQTKAKLAVTDVETLNNENRIEEIARMLAGAQVTDAARQAARSLMEDAVPKKKRA